MVDIVLREKNDTLRHDFIIICFEVYDELDGNEIQVLIDLLEAVAVGKRHLSRIGEE